MNSFVFIAFSAHYINTKLLRHSFSPFEPLTALAMSPPASLLVLPHILTYYNVEAGASQLAET